MANRTTYEPITSYEEFPKPQSGVEAASQAWKAGAPLVSSSGSLAEAGSDPTATLGFATSKASGTTGQRASFIPCNASKMFIGTLDDGNDQGAGAIAQTDQFAEYGLTKDSTTGIWFVDKNKTSGSGRARIIDFIDPVGTVLGLVVFLMSYDQTLYEAS